LNIRFKHFKGELLIEIRAKFFASVIIYAQRKSSVAHCFHLRLRGLRLALAGGLCAESYSPCE
jgi:hypothetical protein